MYDKISKVQKSIIQHGPLSQRIYLMKFGGGSIPKTIGKLDQLCKKNNYSKIIAKIPKENVPVFKDSGYILEASIPGFYNGTDDVAFLSKYFTKERQREQNEIQIKEILMLSKGKSFQDQTIDDISPLRIGVTDLSDAEQMSLLYREVFQTYPFPIHDPKYLSDTMKSHVQYFYVRDGNRMVALSSAEMDLDWSNVEMTDFATLPSYGGMGLATRLLDTMENIMRLKGIKTAYTIARALSVGMNITFAKMGYTYAGTLTNNTNICGNIESMNVWYNHY